MSRTLALAIEVKEMSQSLYTQFKEKGYRTRMTHMKFIFDAAEQVRYRLEVDETASVSPNCWKAVLAIEHVGCDADEPFDENEKLVLPLYEKYEQLKMAYNRQFRED